MILLQNTVKVDKIYRMIKNKCNIIPENIIQNDNNRRNVIVKIKNSNTIYIEYNSLFRMVYYISLSNYRDKNYNKDSIINFFTTKDQNILKIMMDMIVDNDKRSEVRDLQNSIKAVIKIIHFSNVNTSIFYTLPDSLISELKNFLY
jgi:hypothetical protein